MLSSPRVSSQAEIRQEFRMRVERRDALLLPGAANALTARIIEDLGFEAVYLTGAGLEQRPGAPFAPCGAAAGR